MHTEPRQYLLEIIGNKKGKLEASTDGTGRNGRGDSDTSSMKYKAA